MPDIVRNATDLIDNLFQDGQAAGAITEQDMRDFITSVKNPFGSLYFSTPAETVISVAGTYVKAAGTTTLIDSLRIDANSTNNRLRATETVSRKYLVQAKVTLSMASGTNQNVGIQLYKYDNSATSGALIAGTEQRLIVPGTDFVQISTQGLISLDTNDYVEIWVANHTNTNNLEVDYGHLQMIGIFT